MGRSEREGLAGAKEMGSSTAVLSGMPYSVVAQMFRMMMMVLLLLMMMRHAGWPS